MAGNTIVALTDILNNLTQDQKLSVANWAKIQFGLVNPNVFGDKDSMCLMNGWGQSDHFLSYIIETISIFVLVCSFLTVVCTLFALYYNKYAAEENKLNQDSLVYVHKVSGLLVLASLLGVGVSTRFPKTIRLGLSWFTLLVSIAAFGTLVYAINAHNEEDPNSLTRVTKYTGLSVSITAILTISLLIWFISNEQCLK